MGDNPHHAATSAAHLHPAASLEEHGHSLGDTVNGNIGQGLPVGPPTADMPPVPRQQRVSRHQLGHRLLQNSAAPQGPVHIDGALGADASLTPGLPAAGHEQSPVVADTGTSYTGRRRLDAEPDDDWRPLGNAPKLNHTPLDNLPPDLKPLPAGSIHSSQVLRKTYLWAFFLGPLACLAVRRRTALEHVDVRDGLAEMFNAQVAGIIMLCILHAAHAFLRVTAEFFGPFVATWAPGISVFLSGAYTILALICVWQPIRGILKVRDGRPYTSPFVVEFIQPSDSYFRQRVVSRAQVIGHQSCGENGTVEPQHPNR